ncbi:MAG: hypothetical protein AAF228_11745 [Pseudomonadota bacterium]
MHQFPKINNASVEAGNLYQDIGDIYIASAEELDEKVEANERWDSEIRLFILRAETDHLDDIERDFQDCLPGYLEDKKADYIIDHRKHEAA